jgi:hypothetical protein
MALSKERKGEIAYAMLMNQVRKDGLGRLSRKDIRREIGNALEMPELKEIKLTQAEAKEWVKEMLDDIIKDVYEELK